MLFCTAHCSVLTSYFWPWSRDFGQNPGLCGKSMLLVRVFESALHLSQRIREPGVGFAFIRRPESGKTVCKALLSALPSAATATGSWGGEANWIQREGTKFYNLFRRSHLFNGKICLHHAGCYGLYIKCITTLSKLWYEVQFEYCVLKIIKKKDHPSPSPPIWEAVIPRAGKEALRDITKLYLLSASGPCLPSTMREALYALPTLPLLWTAKTICSAEVTSHQTTACILHSLIGPPKWRGSLALEGGRQSQGDFVLFTYEEKDACNEMKMNFSEGPLGGRNHGKLSD